MTSRLWFLVEMAAQPLESDTRRAVLGDVLESGEGVWGGLLDVLGLVIRQQVLMLKSWRPWLVVFALAVPGCLVLMGLSVSVSLTLERLGEHGLTEGVVPSIRSALLLLLCRGVLLVCCAWACGFAMASISRKTFWVSSVPCCFPCLLCLVRFREASLSRLCLFLFLLPAVWGTRQALRATHISVAMALLVAVSTTTLAILLTNGKGVWTIDWVLVWPAWYVVAVLWRKSRKPQLI